MVVARLEAELAAIMKQEERLAELTKERDGLVRVRREVQKRFDVVDVYLADFAKVSRNRCRADIRRATLWPARYGTWLKAARRRNL